MKITVESTEGFALKEDLSDRGNDTKVVWEEATDHQDTDDMVTAFRRLLIAFGCDNGAIVRSLRDVADEFDEGEDKEDLDKFYCEFLNAQKEADEKAEVWRNARTRE